MSEVILKMKLGGKTISCKQETEFGGGMQVIVPFIMVKRILFSLIFKLVGLNKKGIPIYELYSMEKLKLKEPDWWKQKKFRKLTKEENEKLKKSMEKLFEEISKEAKE